MKSFLIIGMGSLGHHICYEFIKNGCDVMVADISAEAMDDVLGDVASARVCDCTRREVLADFGVDEFDACFVCVGDNFQNCLEITDQLRELGAKKIYSSCDRGIEEKFLLRNGADHVIYPERDIARRIAGSESSQSVFDCINLTDDFAIYEIAPLDKWVGKTVRNIDFRNKYNLNIVAFKDGDKVMPLSRNDYIFKKEEHLLVLGHIEDVKKVFKL